MSYNTAHDWTNAVHDWTTSLPDRSADDFTTIRKHLRRNRVEAAIQQAGLTTGAIPDSILLAAGYTPEEIAQLGSQRNLPLTPTDLLL